MIIAETDFVLIKFDFNKIILYFLRKFAFRYIKESKIIYIKHKDYEKNASNYQQN